MTEKQGTIEAPYREKSDFLARLRKHRDYTPREKSMIVRAMEFSAKQYGTRLHKSGIPLLVHVFNLADQLLDIHADSSVIVLALIHDLPGNTAITYSDIEVTFGSSMADLTRGVQKMGRMRTDNENLHREDLNYMLTTMSRDVRIAIVRLIHRLHDLRTEKIVGSEDQLYLATETIDLYVPLAGRLGMNMIKNEIENLCFRIISPDLYQEIQSQLSRTEAEDFEYLDHIKGSIRRLLQNEKISARIIGRIKSTYSIYRKIVKRNIPFDKVYDKLAIRIILESVSQCYQILGIIHTHFMPIQETFDDYIATPKSNNYQSLHTAIYPVKGIAYKPVEIQIRTERMNQDSEYGAAAHWRYKDQDFLVTDSEEHKRWFTSLITLREKFGRHDEFIQALKSDVFEENIIIFDHLGKMIYLPAKATAKDFAEYLDIPIHQDKVVAKVNGRICPLSKSLKSGDTLEICDWCDEIQNCFPYDSNSENGLEYDDEAKIFHNETRFANEGGPHYEKRK